MQNKVQEDRSSKNDEILAQIKRKRYEEINKLLKEELVMVFL